MNQQEGKKQRKRLGALDVCIIVVILLIVVGVAARMVFKEDSVLAQNTPLDTYTVYFTISNIRQTSSVYLQDGKEFWIDEDDSYFGVLTGTPTTTPAKVMYVDDEGNTVAVYNNTEDDRVSRIDAEGAFTVSAKLDENGFLMLNGNRYIAPNKEIALRSKELYVNIRITSIVKAD